jgi:hypothetical protein
MNVAMTELANELDELAIAAVHEPQIEQAPSSAHPLCEGATLQHVLGYLGPGHYLFVALVSRAWAHSYSHVPAHPTLGRNATLGPTY